MIANERGTMIVDVQGTIEKVEVDRNNRPLRKVTKKKVDYSLMVASEKDDKECRTSRQKAQEEEEIEGWVKAVVEMQQRRFVNLSSFCWALFVKHI